MPDERISVSELKSELGDLINDTQDIFTIASDEGIVDFLWLGSWPNPKMLEGFCKINV